MSKWKLIYEYLGKSDRLVKELGIGKLKTSENNNKVMENNVEFEFILMEDFRGEIIEGYRFRMQDPYYSVDIPIDIFNFIREL